MTNIVYQRNSKSITKKYSEYFVPTVLTVMAANIAAVVDSVIAGNMIGAGALAAINLLSPLIQLYAALAVLIGLGLSATAAKAMGENDAKGADGLYTVGIAALAVMSAALMAVQLPFMKGICSLLTADKEIGKMLFDYYLPFVISTPLYLFLECFIYILRIDNRPKFATNLIITANAVNLLLDIVYIKAFNWGIMGMSLATATGQLIAFIILCSHFTAKKNTLHFNKNVFLGVKKCLGYVKTLFATGFSAALGMLLLVIKLQFINSVVQKLSGSAGLVAFSVYKNALMIISMFIAGGSETMIPIIGMCMGEKDYEGVKFAFWRAVRVMLISSAAIILILILTPESITRVFGVADGEAFACSINALRISAVSFAGVSISFLLMYYYMAIGKKALSMAVSVLNTIALVIPSVLICSKIFGINGVWISFVLSEALTILFVYIVTLIIKSKSNGKYKSFLLLDESAGAGAMSLSFDASVKDSAGVSEYIMSALKNHGDENANKTALAVEDITAQIAKASGKRTNIDVRVLTGEETIISIRYNGKRFNPIEADDETEFSAVKVVEAISKEMEYSSVMGFNRIIIKI